MGFPALASRQLTQCCSNRVFVETNFEASNTRLLTKARSLKRDFPVHVLFWANFACTRPMKVFLSKDLQVMDFVLQ